MTIAVTTPTGHVGQHVLRLLVQAGERPRALLRDPEALDPALRDLVEVARLDVSDSASVLDAIIGLTALYWVSPTITDDPVGAHRRTAEHLRAAVERNAVPRVVFQSSGGAEKRTGMGEIDGLAAIEEALDATDADVTHLRCGYFFSNLELEAESLRAGVLATAMDVDRPLPWVAPADIAAVAVARLLAPGWSGRQVQDVLGPADLSSRRPAEILAGVLGRPIEVVQLTDEQVRTNLTELGLAPAQIEALVQMTAGTRENTSAGPVRSDRNTTPTTLRGWAAAHLV